MFGVYTKKNAGARRELANLRKDSRGMRKELASVRKESKGARKELKGARSCARKECKEHTRSSRVRVQSARELLCARSLKKLVSACKELKGA